MRRIEDELKDVDIEINELRLDMIWLEDARFNDDSLEKAHLLSYLESKIRELISERFKLNKKIYL